MIEQEPGNVSFEVNTRSLTLRETLIYRELSSLFAISYLHRPCLREVCPVFQMIKLFPFQFDVLQTNVTMDCHSHLEMGKGVPQRSLLLMLPNSQFSAFNLICLSQLSHPSKLIFATFNSDCMYDNESNRYLKGTTCFCGVGQNLMHVYTYISIAITDKNEILCLMYAKCLTGKP